MDEFKIFVRRRKVECLRVILESTTYHYIYFVDIIQIIPVFLVAFHNT